MVVEEEDLVPLLGIESLIVYLT